MRRRRHLAGVAVAALVLLTAGCSVPTGGGVTVIPASDVPYGLASSPPAAQAGPSVPPAAGQPQIFLVAPDGRLRAGGRTIVGASRRDRLGALLADLAAGPTPDERSAQLSSSLPPDVLLAVADITGTRAVISLAGGRDGPSGRESRRAVAQIVLTATSLRGIDSVLLVSAGAPVDAPLPSGELTSAPLTAADYAGLLAPSAPPS